MQLVALEDNRDLDMEWVGLMMDARSKGFTKDDVRRILLCLAESGNDNRNDAAV